MMKSNFKDQSFQNLHLLDEKDFSSYMMYRKDEDNPLTRGYLLSIIELCKNENNWSALLSLLEVVFSSKNNLSKSFLLGSDDDDRDGEVIEKANSEISEKNCIHSLLYPRDLHTVDIRSVRESFKVLYSLDGVDFFKPIKKGIDHLLHTLRQTLFSMSSSSWSMASQQNHHNQSSKAVAKDVSLTEPLQQWHEMMNVLIILFEIPHVTDPIRFEQILPQLCEIVALLPLHARAMLTEIFSRILKDDDRIVQLHQILQQRITLRLLTTEYQSPYLAPHKDGEIVNAILVLQCVFYASILAGQVDSVAQLESERLYNVEFLNSFCFHSARGPLPFVNSSDEMSKALSIHPMDCRYPRIPYADFVNETLNSSINIENDCTWLRRPGALNEFSFVQYSFLLSTHTKSIIMFNDNRVRMRNESNNDVFLLFNGGKRFKLIVDRENLVDDTLNGLELAISMDINTLKKRLYIEFKNEMSADEGGVSKEFFQLIVESIFNPDYGMFVFHEETKMFWFNPFPMEDMHREYRLIGIILGLAIYNNVILDLRLPLVLYRKLMGKLGSFEDLKQTHPSLSVGLNGLLECDPDDVDVIFDQNFQISLIDTFGHVRVVDLKPNGSNIPLTWENREEYVALYANYLLNESVCQQFNAFYEGFQMVIDESPLKLIFRPDEIELLVCGSKNFDFYQLEKITKYDGFTSSSKTVINFWKTVHGMTKEQHSQLLQFTTGSDRIPVGGMQKMEFKIMRHGSDTNKLPTAQTCFNTLMLPDYNSKEKLKTLLLKAITYSKGFGII